MEGRRGSVILNFSNTPDRFDLPKFLAKTLYDQAHPIRRKINPQPTH